jgi:hypothetical protein
VFEDSNVLGLGKNYRGKMGFSRNQNPLIKETKNPSRYYNNSILTYLKFQNKPNFHLSKILL